MPDCFRLDRRSLSVQLFSRDRHVLRRLMQDHAFERIELALPCSTRERAPGRLIAGVPTHADAGRTEIDILGVIFAIELRRQQADYVHLCGAAEARELL